MDKFLVKLLGNGVIVFGLILLMSNATLLGAFLTAIALSILAYLFGDLFVLPRTNNAIATLTDGVLAFIFLWGAAAGAGWSLSLGEILIITLVVCAFEYFFHFWLLKDGIRRDSSVRVRR